jgi:hypothetical protein
VIHLMKLRDHPLMAYRTMRNWPPVWIEKYADNKSVTGEVGVLTHVGADSERSNRCYLHIAYNDKPYVGSLLFDDRPFCMFVGNLLKRHIHESIEAIGDLDVSYTL